MPDGAVPPRPPLAIPIRVALHVADRDTRERIAACCEEAPGDIVIADVDDAPDDADIVVADHAPATTAPVIAVVTGDTAPPWPCNICAVVPPDGEAIDAVIRVVAAGLTVMPRPGGWSGPLDPAHDRDDEPALTPREREVLALLAEGASNKAIARALGVSVHTAKFHVASVAAKLGANGRLETVAIAIRSGLVMV